MKIRSHCVAIVGAEGQLQHIAATNSGRAVAHSRVSVPPTSRAFGRSALVGYPKRGSSRSTPGVRGERFYATKVTPPHDARSMHCAGADCTSHEEAALSGGAPTTLNEANERRKRVA